MKMLSAVLAAMLLPGAAGAQVFPEAADAGQTLATATDLSTGAGTTLGAITGSMPDDQDVDLFKIYIASPGAFSATTVNRGTDSLFDTALYLFDADGHAIATNDDAGGQLLNSTLPVGDVLYRDLLAGTYYLGIGQSGNEPENGGSPAANQLLFATGLTTAVRGAASGLDPTTLDHFNGRTNFADAGSYRIDLAGVTLGAPLVGGAVPEPTTWALMLAGFGLVGVVARRRRWQTA